MPYLRLGMPSLFLYQLHCLFIAADEPYFNFIARPHRDFLNDSRSQRIVIFLDLHIFGRQQHFRLTDFFLSGGAVLDAFFQTLNFTIQLFQPVIEKRRILIEVQGHFQQSVKFLLGLLQLLLQIGLCAFAGLDVMQDTVDLGSDFIGKVCSQILHRFQNGTVQFFFRDGR